MAKCINTCTLCGNVGKDPEMRTLSDGTKVASFSLATSTGGFTTRDGRKVEEHTNWHNIVVWRGMAEFCCDKVKKGMTITVVGEIAYREYTDKNNVKRQATDILARDICLLGNRQNDSQRTQADNAQPQAPQTPAQSYQQSPAYQQQAVPFTSQNEPPF